MARVANTISTFVKDGFNNIILLCDSASINNETGRSMKKLMGYGLFGPFVDEVDQYNRTINLSGPILFPMNYFYLNGQQDTTISPEIAQSGLIGYGDVHVGDPNGITTGVLAYATPLAWLTGNSPTTGSPIMGQFIDRCLLDNISITIGESADVSVSMSSKLPYSYYKQLENIDTTGPQGSIINDPPEGDEDRLDGGEVQNSTEEDEGDSTGPDITDPFPISPFDNTLGNVVTNDVPYLQIVNRPRIMTDDFLYTQEHVKFFILRNTNPLDNLIYKSATVNIKFEYTRMDSLPAPIPGVPSIRTFPIVPQILTGVTIDIDYDLLFLGLNQSGTHAQSTVWTGDELMTRMDLGPTVVTSLGAPPADYTNIFANTSLGYIGVVLWSVLSHLGIRDRSTIKWVVKSHNLDNISGNDIANRKISYGSSLFIDPFKVQ